MKKKIVITGATGQLGRTIQHISTQSSDFEFFFYDVEHLDICNEKQVHHMMPDNVDIIINCAAYTAVDKAEGDRILAQKINVDGPKILASFAKERKAHLIQISTDYVFDGKACMPYDENDKTNPMSVYGKTKRDGELAIEESGCNATLIRTAWLYSTFGNNFVYTILRLARERSELGIVFDQIGTPTYAADLARAILKICTQLKEGYRLFHFSNEGVCSWYDFAKEIVDISGLPCKIMPIETKDYPTLAARPSYSVLNKSGIKKELAIEIPHWKDSLLTCMSQLEELGVY